MDTRTHLLDIITKYCVLFTVDKELHRLLLFEPRLILSNTKTRFLFQIPTQSQILMSSVILQTSNQIGSSLVQMKPTPLKV